VTYSCKLAKIKSSCVEIKCFSTTSQLQQPRSKPIKDLHGFSQHT